MSDFRSDFNQTMIGALEHPSGVQPNMTGDLLGGFSLENNI